MKLLGSGALGFVGCLMVAVQSQSCSRSERRAAEASQVSPESKRDREASTASSNLPAEVPTVDAATAERTLTFSWKPAHASTREYEMSDPEEQHKILLTRGVREGNAYRVVVALHGQPRRGQAPRSYVFPRVVADVVRQLVNSNRIEPLILVTPVFRFEGQNWPQFELAQFMLEVRKVLAEHGLSIKGAYAVGHSGAAGCGGGGLNTVSDASLNAVGFFDTCIGAGLLQQVRALEKNRTVTLIIHSVETAGFQPRQPVEYDAHFDFGRVYSSVGLHRATCPLHLPEAPLRDLNFRCAVNDAGTTLALVVDTGQGEKAHEALVPVALRYFLQEYLAK